MELSRCKNVNFHLAQKVYILQEVCKCKLNICIRDQAVFSPKKINLVKRNKIFNFKKIMLQQDGK